MPRGRVAFCPSPLLLGKAERRAVGITPRRPRHSVARASNVERGDDSAAYDEFSRMLGKADTPNSDAIRRGVEDDTAPLPKRKADPAMYDAFDTLLERSGGAGRKVKHQQRFVGREGERRRPPATGDAGVDSGREVPGKKTELRQTPSMTRAEVEEGYSFMDEAFAPKKKRTGKDKPSPELSEEQTGPPPVLSGPPPNLSTPPKRDGSPSFSSSSASAVSEPQLIQKPRHGADEPVVWREGASSASDPTRTVTADLSTPRLKAQPESKSMLSKPTTPPTVGSTGSVEETSVRQNARSKASPADTTPLSPEEIEAGYTAMKSFFADDLAAAEEDGDDESSAKFPSLSGPQAAPPSSATKTDAAEISPMKKPLRRVTSDPSTWREDWSDVPDPTRRKVANLDAPLPKSPRPTLPLVEKPTSLVPGGNMETTSSPESGLNAESAAAVSTPSPPLSGAPAAPSANVLAAAKAKTAVIEKRLRVRSTASPLSLENPKVVLKPSNVDQESGGSSVASTEQTDAIGGHSEVS